MISCLVPLALRRRLFLAVVALAAALLWLAPGEASAYPWMIRHEYTACAQCHTDPSGGGILTPYGRAQGEILLRQQWGRDPDAEPGKVADFMFGAFKVPDALLLQGDVRSLFLQVVPFKGKAPDPRFILMQADMAAQVTASRFRANGSLGFAHEGALGASITRGDTSDARQLNRLVSRVHWVGVDLGAENEVLLRAGRMNVPFGIRSLEHTLWTRKETRSDINDAQQYGLAVSYNSGKFRGELMGIAGNFMISPDKVRSRGYAGYAEYALGPKMAIGLSSTLTYTQQDLLLQTKGIRQSHGIFIRSSPTKKVVLMTEIDLLHTTLTTPGAVGLVNATQIDFEPITGLHFGGTFEARQRSFSSEASSVGGWLSAWWFFAPHTDIRVDGILQSLSTPGGSSTGVTSILAQLHVYL